MIPFEALLPYAVIVTMFGVAGGGMAFANTMRQDGKKQRVHRDTWDKYMMERDMRLTSTYREQSSAAVAPERFATSSVWKLNRSWDD
ncbi:uncharacterized protein V1518DRAFT_412719 [Limtongia smithiae]|uniref:uncharacterized protein n=1 Tax=Limtongia smithiae TaxID=1125753 RepID=UPI0034CE2C8F